jgi:hypothetical protein
MAIYFICSALLLGLLLLVLVSAVTLRWRARKISNWIIPFNRAHMELWKAWGIGILFAVIAGGVLGTLGLLNGNQLLNDLVGVGGWIAAYAALRFRLPKLAAVAGVALDQTQLHKISNQVFVYVFLYLFGASLLFAIVLPLLAGR